MSKNFVKHITVAFLVAIISISTMGVSVNTLYCLCTGARHASFFDIDHKCEKEPSESVTHSEGFSDLAPCCQKALKKAACEKHEKDCTKKTKKRIKADLKFLEIKKTEVPTFELFAEVPVIHHFSENYALKFEFPTAKSETLPRPPPPQYWGRKLLNFIQVYRC